jgi:hypothetical protein
LWLRLSLALVPCGGLSGAFFLNLEEDLRGTYTATTSIVGEINALGGSLRQVFADDLGDRWIIYLQAEAAHNLGEAMLHQTYIQYKGPMGAWNLSLGRVPLPWGLLTAWSPDRKPYPSPYPGAGMFSADSGIVVHGVIDIFDYGFAVTQGYGMGAIADFPGPGMVTGRFALTPDDGAFTAGISFTAGSAYLSTLDHGMGERMVEKRFALALDLTMDLGQGSWRLEGGGRQAHGHWVSTVFTSLEYAVLPWLSLEGAGQVYTSVSGGTNRMHGNFYLGVEMPVFGATLRGGYVYEKMEMAEHRAVVQLHRVFTAAW